MLVLILPRAGTAQEAGEGQPLGSFNLLAPIQNQLSGSTWAAVSGFDPRFWQIQTSRDQPISDSLFAPAPGPRGAAGAAAPIVPFRSAGPAFSRNQIITRQLGIFGIQTEPSIAVDPFDPDHLVMGTIDYNFPSISTYVSIDGGETWDGPNQVRYFQEDLTSAGDPVIAFDSAGYVYVSFISIGLEEFQIGTIASFLEVSSMAVSRSDDGGYTWSDPVSAARSQVTTTSNPDDEGKERGTITSAFLDKEWITTSPNPDNPDQDIIHMSYTEFATTYGLIYSDEVPYLSSPATETTIRYVQSLDGGFTWSEPVAVSPTVLQFAGAGEEGEGGEGAGAAEAADAQAAQVEQQQQQGSLGSLESNRTVQGSQPKVMADGTVVVAYLDTTNDGIQEGLATMMVGLSTDNGKTFGTPIQAAVFREPHFQPRSSTFRWWGSAFPQLAVGLNDEIYIATTFKPAEKPTDDGDIYLLRSLDKGETWEEPTRLNGDDTNRGQFFPSIAVSPNGVLHAMWGDLRGDPQEIRYHIYYTRSEDQGETWGFRDEELNLNEPDTRVSDFGSNSLRGFPGGRFIGDYFSLAASDEDVYMVWADTRLGEFSPPNQQIAFARQTAIANPSIFLNPPNGVAGREVTIQGSGFQSDTNFYVTLGDTTIATGRTSDKGEFTATIFMPITGEGAQNISAFDDTGNFAQASYFTDFGFDSMQQQIAAIQSQLAGSPTPAASVAPSPPPAATPAGTPSAATPVSGSASANVRGAAATGTPVAQSGEGQAFIAGGTADLGGFGGLGNTSIYAVLIGAAVFAGYTWLKRRQV